MAVCSYGLYSHGLHSYGPIWLWPTLRFDLALGVRRRHAPKNWLKIDQGSYIVVKEEDVPWLPRPAHTRTHARTHAPMHTREQAHMHGLTHAKCAHCGLTVLAAVHIIVD